MQPTLIRFILTVLVALPFGLLQSCNSDDYVDDLTDVVKGPPRKTIDQSRTALNAFGNQAFAGSMSAQFAEIRNTLGVNKVRVLLNWDNNSQPTPDSEINFSFMDALFNSIPGNVDVLAIVTGLPGWMSNPANWTGGNPRTTFVSRFVRPVVRRYANRGNLIAWQVWNEPNNTGNGENITLDVVSSPANYVEMLAAAENVIRNLDGGALILNAATTSIVQNYSETLEYNRGMRDAGVTQFIDVYAIHYYGRQFENLIRSGGVADYLNGVGKPIWVTESGIQGVNEQLGYAEQVWPYLDEKVNGVQRFYWYQYAENTPAASTYGLKNPDQNAPVSDLYVWLRDN